MDFSFHIVSVYEAKRAADFSTALLTVGVARLERATACTPCKNASQLHHTPIALAAAKLGMFFELAITLSEKFYLCQQITLNSNP